MLEGAINSGAREAISRLRERMRSCRPGYREITLQDGNLFPDRMVLLADGSIEELHRLSKRVRSEFSYSP